MKLQITIITERTTSTYTKTFDTTAEDFNRKDVSDKAYEIERAARYAYKGLLKPGENVLQFEDDDLGVITINVLKTIGVACKIIED